jgi:hypothetical protein
MPAVRTKTYLVKAAPGVTTGTPPIPTNPRRIALFVQNTGAAPGLVRLGDTVKNDGSDILLASGEFIPPWQTPETCPVETVNFFSTDGTTFCVIETVRGD